jgi:hypothetical protein
MMGTEATAVQKKPGNLSFLGTWPSCSVYSGGSPEGMEALDAAARSIMMSKLLRGGGPGVSSCISIGADIGIGECGVVGDYLESLWLSEIIRLVSECGWTVKKEAYSSRGCRMTVRAEGKQLWLLSAKCDWACPMAFAYAFGPRSQTVTYA